MPTRVCSECGNTEFEQVEPGLLVCIHCGCPYDDENPLYLSTDNRKKQA